VRPKRDRVLYLIEPDQVKNTEDYVENGITTLCSASSAPTTISRSIQI
jgi:hypothetical protein